MINNILKPIHYVIMFLDDMKHLSISQWDINQTEENTQSQQNK